MGTFGPACLLLAFAVGGAPIDSSSVKAVGLGRRQAADTLVVEVCGGAEVVAPLATTRVKFMDAAPTCCDVAAD